jgi:hypothetical protein
MVEALDARAAREQIAAAAPCTLAAKPWLDPALTSCEEVKKH